MRYQPVSLILFIGLLLHAIVAGAEATLENTPYRDEQKVAFDFFLDDPGKTSAALFWVRSYINPLLNAPYDKAPAFMDIKVIMHGTELVTIAKKNYEKYREVVERMKYYHALGVEFRVCALAMEDYDYTTKDLQDFIVVTPSAIVELAHWQQEGYALIRPAVYTRSKSVQEIR